MPNMKNDASRRAVLGALAAVPMTAVAARSSGRDLPEEFNHLNSYKNSTLFREPHIGIAAYDLSASLNNNLAGIDIGEGMTEGDVKGALRQLMADLAAFYQTQFLTTNAISALRNCNSTQLTAIRAGKPIAGLSDAINAVLAAPSSLGQEVKMPAGLYDLRSKLSKPAAMLLSGASPSFPANITNNQGFTWTMGTVLYKNHLENSIEIIGLAPYSASGSIEKLAISSDKISHPTGHGIVLHRVGLYLLKEVRIFSVGGDGILLGLSGKDETGQIHLDDVYVNNPSGACIRNKSRWLKASKIETDGGVYSLYSTDTTNIDFSQFHFEGATVKGIVLAGACRNARFAGGYVALTAVSATTAVELADVAGNTDITFDCVSFFGHAGATGADIGISAWRSAWPSCTFDGFQIGVLDSARQTNLCGVALLNCATPVRTAGDRPIYHNMVIDGTSGAYAIEFTAPGVGGSITGVETDKPFRPAPISITFRDALKGALSGTLDTPWTGRTGPHIITFSDGSKRTVTLKTGSAIVNWVGVIRATKSASALNIFGDFGSTIVKDNPGFKTAGHGRTATQLSGIAIKHGLAITPYTVEVWCDVPSPSDFSWTWDSINIIPIWTGSESLAIQWRASGYCENPE